MMETERVQATPPGFLPGPSLASQEGLLPTQGTPQGGDEARPSDSSASEPAPGPPSTLAAHSRACQAGCLQQHQDPRASPVVGIGGAALQANMQPMKTLFGAPSQLLYRATEAFPCDSRDPPQSDAAVGLLYFLPSYAAAAGATHLSGRALPQLSNRFCASLPKAAASSPDLGEGPSGRGSDPSLEAEGPSAGATSADATSAAAPADAPADGAAAGAAESAALGTPGGGKKGGGRIPGAWSTGRVLVSGVKKSGKLASTLSMNLSIKLKGSRGGGASQGQEDTELAGMLVAKRGCTCVPCQPGAVPVTFSLRDPSQAESPPLGRQRSFSRSFFRSLGPFHAPYASMKARRVSDSEQQQVVARAAPGVPPESENQTVHLPVRRAVAPQSPTKSSHSQPQPQPQGPLPLRTPSQLPPRGAGGGAWPQEPEWAEVFAGEDRGQVMVAAEGYTFAAVYDGFMDCAAVDFLMTHLYPCVADELDALGVPPGMPCRHAHGGFPVHREILGAMERAYEKVERAFFECVHKLHEDQPEMAVAGACVVVALVVGHHLYTLNVGDAAAVLVAEPPSSSPSRPDDPRHSHAHSHSPCDTPCPSGAGSTFGSSEFGQPPLAQSIPIGHSILSTAIPEDRSARSDQMALPRLGTFGEGEGGECEWELGTSFGSAGSEAGHSAGGLAAALGEDSDATDGTNAGEDGGSGSMDAALAMGIARLTVEHNTNNTQEVERVLSEHEDDPRAVDKNRVKGKLKVTRAFGAAFMKEAELNVNLFSCFRIKYVGSKPYLGSKAYVRHTPLDAFQGFLVLSSDGLYQHMQPSVLPGILYPSVDAGVPPTDKEQSTGSGREEAVESSTRCRGIAKQLLDEALARATKANRMSPKELEDVGPGEARRKIHDDITILVLRLGTPPQVNGLPPLGPTRCLTP